MNNFVNKLKTKANRYAELKKQRGMSLLEVIIVLGIIGTMAAAVVILAQRAFSSQDITDLVDNTNTVRVAAGNAYKDAGVYPSAAGTVIGLTPATIPDEKGAAGAMSAILVNLGQASESEIKNGISGDYFYMQGVKLTSTASDTKGFVLTVNGLDQGECRSVLMQVGNSWDYVGVDVAGAGVLAPIPTSLDLPVDITSTTGNATGVLRSLDPTTGMVQITADSASFACDNNNDNAVILGSK